MKHLTLPTYNDRHYCAPPEQSSFQFQALFPHMTIIIIIEHQLNDSCLHWTRSCIPKVAPFGDANGTALLCECSTELWQQGEAVATGAPRYNVVKPKKQHFRVLSLQYTIHLW